MDCNVFGYRAHYSIDLVGAPRDSIVQETGLSDPTQQDYLKGQQQAHHDTQISHKYHDSKNASCDK